MKRVNILLFVCLIFLSLNGCKKERDAAEELTVEYGVYNIDWEESSGTYKGDVIPTKEVAIRVAEQIYEGLPKADHEQNYEPYFILYDEQEQIWIVGFCEIDPLFGGPIGPGSDRCIAIRQSDGKVMRIWSGE